jgi:hypothetical protein
MVKADKSRDQDETRRLLYMALAVPLTEKYNLVGTLTNALAHHGSGLDPDEVMRHVIAVVNGGGGDSEQWVRDRIAEITGP